MQFRFDADQNDHECRPHLATPLERSSTKLQKMSKKMFLKQKNKNEIEKSNFSMIEIKILFLKTKKTPILLFRQDRREIRNSTIHSNFKNRRRL